MPLQDYNFKDYVVSFDSPEICGPLKKCEDIKDLVLTLRPQVRAYTTHPHIAVIATTGAKYNPYDLLVHIYEKPEVHPYIYAYQLKKKGRKYEFEFITNKLITQSILVKGTAEGMRL